jgi:hypothetical protein
MHRSLYGKLHASHCSYLAYALSHWRNSITKEATSSFVSHSAAT